jgi:hypothetical protein
LAHLTTQLDEFFAFRIGDAAKCFYPAALLASGDVVENGSMLVSGLARRVA